MCGCSMAVDFFLVRVRMFSLIPRGMQADEVWVARERARERETLRDAVPVAFCPPL